MAPKADKGRQGTAREAGNGTRLPDVDDDTLKRCIAGDLGAERRILEMYQGPIARLLQARTRPRLSREDLEDLLQEVFLRAFNRKSKSGITSFVPPSQGGEGRLGDWLMAIGRNVLTSGYRRQKRRVRTIGMEDVGEAPSPASPQQGREPAESKQALEAAMSGLSDEHREILALREVEGKSYKEIAAICAIPENTVRSRLFRAREAARKNLKGANDEEGESKDG